MEKGSNFDVVGKISKEQKEKNASARGDFVCDKVSTEKQMEAENKKSEVITSENLSDYQYIQNITNNIEMLSNDDNIKHLLKLFASKDQELKEIAMITLNKFPQKAIDLLYVSLDLEDKYGTFSKMFSEEIIFKLIDIGQGELIFRKLKRFLDATKEFKEELISKLINAELAFQVAYYFNEFKLDYTLQNTIIQKLIDSGNADAVAYNIENFTNIDKEVVNKIILSGHGNAIINNKNEFLKIFPDLEKEWGEVLNNLSENTSSEEKIVENLKKMILQEIVSEHSPYLSEGRKSEISRNKILTSEDILKSIFNVGLYSQLKLKNRGVDFIESYHGAYYQEESYLKAKNGIYELSKKIDTLSDEQKKAFKLDSNKPRIKKVVEILKQNNWYDRWIKYLPEHKEIGNDIDAKKRLAVNVIAQVFFGENLISSEPPEKIKANFKKTGALTEPLHYEMGILFKTPSKIHTHDLSQSTSDLGVANKVPVKDFLAIVMHWKNETILNLIPKNIPVVNTKLKILRMPEIDYNK